MANNGISYSQDAAIAAGQFRKEQDYWLKKLSGELVKTGFPYIHIKKESQGYQFDSVRFKLSQALYERLNQLSGGSDYTLHMIFVSGLVVLLHRYTCSQDIIVGIPIDRQDTGGEFVNTVLALRNQVHGQMTFKDMLLQVRETTIEAAENQNYPIETLLYDLNLTFTPNEFPLFDTAILLENIHEKSYLRDIYCSIILSFLRTGEGIEGELEYNSCLYGRDSIERIIEHFKHLLNEALNDVNSRIFDLKLLSEKEKQRLLFDFNRIHSAPAVNRTVYESFKQQVERNPHYTVLAADDEQLTYKMINREAARLAQTLQAKGAAADTIIAIMTERSPEMIVGMLGIFKAGGLICPLAPPPPDKESILYLKTVG